MMPGNSVSGASWRKRRRGSSNPQAHGQARQPHAETFFIALNSRSNRMVWGALTAIAALTVARPDAVAARLDDVLEAAERSSVIAKDAAFSILATLSALPAHQVLAWPRLLSALRTSAVNQSPMYAEKALDAAPMNSPEALAKVVEARLTDIHQPPMRARLEGVLRKLASMQGDS